ncbi:hypothetical protein H4R35_005302, partial [Dimargaris xerosporica]
QRAVAVKESLTFNCGHSQGLEKDHCSRLPYRLVVEVVVDTTSMTGIFNKAAKAMGLSDENAQHEQGAGGQTNTMMDSSDRARFTNSTTNRTTAGTNDTRYTAGRPQAIDTTGAYGRSSGYAGQDFAGRDAADITTDSYRTGTYATSSGDYNNNNSLSAGRNYGQTNTSLASGMGNRPVGTRGLTSWVNDYDYDNNNSARGMGDRTNTYGDRQSSGGGNQYNATNSTDFYGNRTEYNGGGSSMGNTAKRTSTGVSGIEHSNPDAITQSATVGSRAASSGDYGVNNQNSTVGISGNDAYRQTGTTAGTTGTTTTTGSRAGIGAGSSGYGDFGREQDSAGLDTSTYGGHSNVTQNTKPEASAGYDDPYSSYTATGGGDYKSLGVSGNGGRATGADHKPRHRGTGGISPTHGFADHPRANDGGYAGGRRRSSNERRSGGSYSSSSSSSDHPQTGIGSGVHDNTYNTSSRDTAYDQSNAVPGQSAGVVGSGTMAGGGMYGSSSGHATAGTTRGSSGYGAGDRLNNPNSIALDSNDPTVGTRYDSNYGAGANAMDTNVGHYNNTGTTAPGGTALGTNVPASGATGGAGATSGYPTAGRSGVDDSSRFNRGNATAPGTHDQLHSGRAGGPATNRRPSFGDRIKGAMKQATGTIMRDQEMKLEGEQMRTYGSHATDGTGHTTSGRY